MEGLGFGLLVAALSMGLRHGIDWDHIAAITDITGSQDDRRKAILFGTLYVLGHAAVVFTLGVVAIVLERFIPPGLDELMARVVGVTLVVLGVYIFVSLARHGRDFRLRSRWMLVFAGFRRGARWVRERVGAAGEAAPARSAGDHPPVSLLHHGHHGRPGHHHHGEADRHEDIPGYGRGTAFGVGMIHGIGAETPTQVLLFITAAGAGGRVAGILVLLAFIVGLLISNSIITVGSAMGFLSASRHFGIYATVAVMAGMFSLVIGVLFLFGLESVLPAFFGG